MMNSNEQHNFKLDDELQEATMFELLELYKREGLKYKELCLKYVENREYLTEKGIQNIKEMCKFHENSKTKIALRIADDLTK